ncbi:uncharacterized protein LOC122265179 [Penaeus japonicus]|uniref:uncharacterized protein LOC122265179 n=1 Tax=Penaeus japonicus TaxID=27405 RepID=UPI001C70C878|nr:uncharacterized protein LOC122265179 [Penaeus japonicus]
MKMVDNSSYTMVTRRPVMTSRTSNNNPTCDHHNNNNNFLAEVATNTTNTTTVTSLPSLNNPLHAQNDNGNVVSLGSHHPRTSPTMGPSRNFPDKSNSSSLRATHSVSDNSGGNVLSQQQMGSNTMQLPPESNAWDEEAGGVVAGSTLAKSATQPSLCPAAASPLQPCPISPSCQSEAGFTWISGTINGGTLGPTVSGGDSTDDLHGEVSEYTDAKSSLSAPVELLSEFLSAVMSKDYENALKLCQSILKYEPQNATAREFFPLISLKIKQMSAAANLECHSSTDEGNESDEDTMDSYSSLEDEIDDDQALATQEPSPNQKPSLQDSASLPTPRTRTTEDTIIRIATPVQSSPESAMSGSNSLDFSYGIDSADSLFSSTESDLTLESVVNATQSIDLGDS